MEKGSVCYVFELRVDRRRAHTARRQCCVALAVPSVVCVDWSVCVCVLVVFFFFHLWLVLG